MMHKPFKKGLIISLALSLLLAASGCQPNPTVPPVVGKGNLEEKVIDRTPAPSSAAAGTATDAASAAPAATQQNVKETYQSGKLAVSIDAAVELPAVGKLPVVKAQPRKFTQAEADKIVKVLLQGKQAYKPKEQMSKSEIEKQIVDMQAMKSQASREYKDAMIKKLDTGIKYMQDQLKTAPETVPQIASDGKFKTDDMGGMELNVTASLGKDNDANLDIYNSSTGRTCSVWFTNEGQGDSCLGNEMKLSGTPKGVKLTLEQAKAMAEKTVSDLGSDLKLADTGICNTKMRTKGNKPEADAPQAWFFAFTREVGGVPSTYETDVGGNVPQNEINEADDTGKGDFIEPHPYERILMAIDDTGILEFQWMSPDKLLDTVSADAQTIPFSQVMDTFQKQFFLHNALQKKSDVKPIYAKDGTEIPQDFSKSMRDQGIFTMDSIGYEEDIKTCTYKIDRVTLGLSRIAVKDKPDEFMIVPVWDFFGTAAVEYTPESGYAGFTTTDASKSFLTINAIDGSIINRSYGY